MPRVCAAHPRSACEAGMGLCARCIPCGSRVVTPFLKWRVGTPRRFEHGPTSLVSEPQAQALPSLPGMEGALVARTCSRRPRPVSRGCWPRSAPCHTDIRSAITWKRPGAEPRKKTPRAQGGAFASDGCGPSGLATAEEAEPDEAEPQKSHRARLRYLPGRGRSTNGGVF